MKQYSIVAIILCVNFFYTLHYTISSYINSSFLEAFAGINYVGIIFTVSAICAIAILSQMERLLIRYGNFRVIINTLSIDICALIGITLYSFYDISISPLIPIIFFIIHYISAVFILRCSLDIYYKEETVGRAVGMAQGKLLFTSNVAWLISPLIFGQLLTDGDFWRVYLLSTVLAIFLLLVVIIYFRNLNEPKYQKIYLRGTLKEAWKNKDVFRIFSANLLLHIFFSWMIIYLPLHLHETIGFSWKEIGFLFSLMLIPYVLVDIPFGYISDKFFGEKELLQIGFLITFAFTFPIALIIEANFLLWAIILIGSRLGAATLEVMTDVYFFKKIDERDANLISFYRNAAPLAYVAGPFLGSILLVTGWFTEGLLFIVLSAILFMGLFVIAPLKDTN